MISKTESKMARLLQLLDPVFFDFEMRLQLTNRRTRARDAASISKADGKEHHLSGNR